MAADTLDPGEYYMSRRAQARQAEHRRWDRRAQMGVLVLAAVVGVAAGLLGTHRSWEHQESPQATIIHPAVAHRP